MFQSKFNSTLISITLAFTLLISALAASYIIPTRALPPTEFTLNAVLSPDPFWGYYGGYWAIWDELKPELAEIGIDLQLITKSDIYDIWEIMWSPSVPEGGQPGGVWDAIMMEWWTQQQGFLWMDGIILSQNLMNGELAGFNPFPYLNPANDEFYWGMQTNFGVATRKAYADAWQAEMMHDPPVINIYYPHVYEVRGDYMEGYNGYVWTNQVSHVNLNLTRVQEMYTAGNLSATAYDRLYNQKTINYGASEAWWNFLPPYVDSYTEEEFQTLIFQTLYRLDISPWPTSDDYAVDPQDYSVMPWLATEDPIFNDTFTDWDGEQVYRYTVPLREGIQWSDGHPFDAEDVVWTYNDIVLDFDLGATSAGDFAPIVKRAEYIHNATPGSLGYNATALNLVLFEPYVDLTLILANDWGLAIVPHHHFGGVPPKFEDPANKKLTGPTGAINVPALGPFKYEAEGSPPSYSWVSLVRNNKFFGFNTSIISPAWGPYNVDKWIFEYVPEAAQRLLKIQLHDVDYAEYPTSPIEVFEGFIGDPNFVSYIDHYPSANPVWFNLNNADLSNRYTRLAIAYAIPYADIFKDVLPSWGVTDPIPGGSLLHPWQYYGGVQLWNSEMPRYAYDLTIARQYLDMYLYSKTATDYTKGPVGDANFDGIVDLDDLYYWIEEYGNAPLTRTLENEDWLDPDWYSSYPWPAGAGDSVAPGNDIDADFDNSGNTGPEDYAHWLANVGKEYPFSGAF